MAEGLVTKNLSSSWEVSAEGGKIRCAARGRLKADGAVAVGDRVLVENGVIVRVLPRRNLLSRPFVANVDLCLILLAPEPEPDFLLADKLIVNALHSGVTPVLLLNKDDIPDPSFRETAEREYGKSFEMMEISARTGDGLDGVLRRASGLTACLAGQSAVGKTSLMNALAGADGRTGGLSRKTGRGRHVTTFSEIVSVGDARLIDTAGFSVFSFEPGFPPEELREYYPEFSGLAENCRFRGSCLHLDEPGCAVKEAVSEGRIPAGRYGRYRKLYEELSVQRRLSYGR